MKATEIKGLEVQFVSYVAKGANKKQFFIVKSKNKEGLQKKANIRQDVKIVIDKNKTKENNNEDENTPHLIYGVVVEPGTVDTDGEFMRKDEIKKTAHSFLKNYRLIDEQHNKIPGAGEVVESYVLLDDMEVGNETIKQGSWVLVTQPDNEIWELIKSGEYTGYSLYGFAQELVEDTEVEKANMWEKLKSMFGIKKDFSSELENYKNNDIYHLFQVFEQAMYSIDWELTGEDYRDELVKSLKQLTQHVEDMTFERIEKSELIGKPYPNEHACRLNNPDNYDEFSRTTRKSGNKEYSVIFGIKGDTSEEQAYRYKKDVWTAEEAKKHCKDHDGSFHEAENEESKKNNKSNENIKNNKNNKQGEAMNEKTKQEVSELFDEKIKSFKDEFDISDLIKAKKDAEETDEGEDTPTETEKLQEQVETLTEKIKALEDSKEEDEDDSDNGEDKENEAEKIKSEIKDVKDKISTIEKAMTDSGKYKPEKKNDDSDTGDEDGGDSKFRVDFSKRTNII